MSFKERWEEVARLACRKIGMITVRKVIKGWDRKESNLFSVSAVDKARRKELKLHKRDSWQYLESLSSRMDDEALVWIAWRRCGVSITGSLNS